MGIESTGRNLHEAGRDASTLEVRALLLVIAILTCLQSHYQAGGQAFPPLPDR